MDERHPLGIPTPTRGGVAEVHAPGRLIRGRRPGLAAYRRRFKTLPHSTGPALSGSSAPLHSSPRAGNATGRGSVGTANRVPWRWHPQSWRGPQRKRSWRHLARSWQRAGVRPNVGGGCGDLVLHRSYSNVLAAFLSQIGHVYVSIEDDSSELSSARCCTVAAHELGRGWGH